MEENVERFCMAQERARRVLRHKPVRAWERSEWNTVSQNKTLSLSLSLFLSLSAGWFRTMTLKMPPR